MASGKAVYPLAAKAKRWDEVLFVLAAYRLLSPGSEWRLHRERFDKSALADLLGLDAVLGAINTLYRCHDRLPANKQAVFDPMLDFQLGQDAAELLVLQTKPRNLPNQVAHNPDQAVVGQASQPIRLRRGHPQLESHSSALNFPAARKSAPVAIRRSSAMQTRCSAGEMGFGRADARRVVADFDGGMAWSDAGALLPAGADTAIGLIDRFVSCLGDRRGPLFTVHALKAVVARRVFGPALGDEDLNDHDELRLDPVLGVLLGAMATRPRREHHEQTGHAVAFAFIVMPRGFSRLDGDRRTRLDESGSSNLFKLVEATPTPRRRPSCSASVHFFSTEGFRPAIMGHERKTRAARRGGRLAAAVRAGEPRHGTGGPARGLRSREGACLRFGGD